MQVTYLSCEMRLSPFPFSHYGIIDETYIIGVKLFLKSIVAISKTTEDKSVNTVPQILYDQYLILGVFGSYVF